MTEAVGKEIAIEGVDPRELYGPRNVYLDQIKALHPQLRIVARGSSLKVLGSEAETQRFGRHMEGLVAYYLKYGHISSEVIGQAFAGDIAGQEAPADKDVIVYGNNGNIIRARTVNQQKLVKLYDKNDLLFAVGPAGSGKTYTAIALAVRALKEKEVRRIILTRPAVEAGEKLGFLPGDMKEKLDPYLQPLYDALNDMIPPAKLAKYLEEGTVQIAPLAYMRGRTLDNAFVILDEAQNTTLSQIKMFLTRMGRNARFIVTGDVTQIDLPKKSDSGLTRSMEILRGVEGIGIVEFDKRDIVRHQLVKYIVDAFDKYAGDTRKEPEQSNLKNRIVMDKNLSALKPALVWKHFAQIVRIPRPSSHEEKIRKYVMDFAKSRGLECKEDAAHNVYVRKPASKGMEDRKGVILQAHLDMVPQKNNDKKFDFTKDPIDAYIDGEWVTADGTTLGADNGIGAAAILAVLEDDTLVHGPLEALFTATEETGMDGAFGLKKGLLRGDILLNLDSETEGELYVGCAGGLDANVTFKYAAEKTPVRNYTAAKITVKGLKGGHSGIQIGCQRANANKVLFRFLNAASASHDVLLCSVDGGGLRNAIPREAEAVVMVKTKEYEAFAKELKAYEKVVKAEYAGIEDAVSVKIRECEAPAEMVAREVAEKLTKAVVGCPDGVQKMSMAMPGLVQTSSNLARVVSDGKTVKLQCLLRSSVNTEKAALGEAIAAVFSLAGAKVQLSGSYDGWNPDMDSPILKAMTASYKALYGKQPAVTAIHAGLECGIIGSKYPKMDMISFGPTICYPHSPDEKVEIASVGKFYEFMVDTLRNIPKK